MFKLVYIYKANPHFSDKILQKRFSSYIQVNLGILFLLDKQKKSHLYRYWSNIMQELHESQKLK
jgi:hypothetical protein